MLAVPKLTPVTCGAVAGCVDPAGIMTLAGETLTFVASLLVSVTVTPPVGAGVGNVTWKAADCPRATLTLAGSEMAPEAWTVTLAVALGMSCALAVIVVEPALTPCTATVAVVAFAAIDAVAGTFTMPPGLALRLTVSPPAGAGPDRVTVKFLDSVPVSVRLAGVKLSEAVVCTVRVAVPYPGAEAVMLAEPTFTPVTCGCAAGCVCPAGMSTDVGEMLTFAGSLLESVTVTPP